MSVKLKINEKFVKNIAFSSLEQFKTIGNEDSVFRVLRLTNCANLKNVFDNETVRNVLTKSLHCFFLSIQLNDGSDLIDIKKAIGDVFHDSQRYCLVEIFQGQQKISRHVFYHRKVTQLDDEKNEGSKVYNSNHGLNTFYLECIGSKSLLDYEITSSDYQKFADLSSEKRNPILMKILKLFNKDLDEDFEKTILRTLVTDSDKTTIEAYLDLPIVDTKKPFLPTEMIRRIIDYKYDESLTTLLCIAAEKKDCDMVKLFLRFGASVGVQDKSSRTASDYALRANQFETLKLLLMNDAPFPQEFQTCYYDLSISELGVKKEIARISDERDKLHDNIETKNLAEIKKFKNKNPNLRYAYKSMRDPPFSKAALSTAQSKTCEDHDYAFYVECLEQQFTIDSSEDILELQHKKEINIIMLNKFHRQDFSHILFLEAKTRLAFEVSKKDYEKNMYDIKCIFRKLSKTKEIDDLLKILEFSKSLEIVIDPINKGVNKMDLTANEETDGLIHHNLGRIYVSTAGKDKNQIAGVLVHELTHYALQIIFKNSCNPYGVHDKIKKESFYKILKDIESLNDKNNEVIQQVFNKFNTKYVYKPHMWPSELIARVPQLIALKDTKMFENEYSKLYKFYTDNVLPIANSLTSNAEKFKILREVEQLNENLGHIEKIEKRDIWLSNNRIETEKIDSKKRTIVVCNIPRLAFVAFYQVFIKPKLLNSAVALDDKENVFIVASTDDFKSSQKKSDIIRVWSLTRDITLIVKCENTFENMDHCNLLKHKSAPDTLILVGDDKIFLETMIKKTILGKEVEIPDSIELNYEWDDVEDNSRASILKNTMISFQGINIKMSNLIDDQFPSGKIPLKKLVNGEKISIERSKVLVDEYDPDEFIERGFVNFENFKSFLDSSQTEKVVMISGDAGIGKSVILSHIALKIKENNKEFWVTRVNLHEHTKAFAKLRTQEFNVFEFLSENFIKAHEEEDREFAQQLFKQLYNDGKVFILLDAVDEIFPFYSEACNYLLQGLINDGKVHLWITTRPHLRQSLENLLPVTSFHLKTFSKEDQLNYVKNVWKKSLTPSLKLNDVHLDEELEACAKTVLSKFDYSMNEYRHSNVKPIELPLETKMIAEAFFENVENHFKGIHKINDLSNEHISIYSLFDKFVLQKILIVKKKGIAVEMEKVKNEIKSQDIIHIHERLALRFMYKQKNIDDPQAYIYSHDHFDDNNFIMNKDLFQRYGLVCFDSNEEPYFLHQTFAQFFVANFISKSLNNMNYVPPPAKSSVAISVLFKNVISIFQDDQTLLRFVDEEFKNTLIDMEDNGVGYKVSTYLRKFVNNGSVEKFTNLKYIDYCLNEDAVFVLNLILKCVEYFDNETAEVVIMKNDYNMFMHTSKKNVKCFVQLVWRIAVKICKNQLQKLQDFFLQLYPGYNAFQYAFMNFPENRSAVVKNYANLDEFADAFSNDKIFEEILKREIRNKTTLETLFEIANSLFGDDKEGREVKRNLIISGSDKGPSEEEIISEDYFLSSLDEKWDIMLRLAPDVISTNWKYLTTKTLFKEITKIIFNMFSNKIVKQFYEWAHQKNLEDYKWLVEDTFVKYFWNCREENGVICLLDFIRNEIGVENILQIKTLVNIFQTHPELAENLMKAFRFPKVFPILGSYLFDSEFEALLLTPNAEGDRMISAYLKSEYFFTENFINMLEVLNKKYVKSRLPEELANSYDMKDLVNIFWKVFSIQNEFTFNSIVDFMMNVFPIYQLKDLLKSENGDNKTLFQAAAGMRSMFFFSKLWFFARNIFDDDALEKILLNSGVLM